MTENEAKRPTIAIIGGARNAGRTLKAHIELLEELEAYRAIGTVEEIYSMLKVLNRTVSEIHSEVSKYQSIGTIDEFKALKEKAEPKKVAYQIGKNGLKHEKCPTCGSFRVFGNYCTGCGQKIDWGNE